MVGCEDFNASIWPYVIKMLSAMVECQMYQYGIDDVFFL